MSIDQNKYRMLWQISKFCNFTCEYCCTNIDTERCADHKEFEPENIAKCFNDTGKIWLISITGGEPFLYPKFVELAKALTKKHYLQIASNLSTENIYEFVDTIPPDKISCINAALHILEREKRNKIDDFIKKILYIQKKGIPVSMNYVTYPSLFPRLKKDMDLFKAHGIETDLKVFRGRYKNRRYPKAYSTAEKEMISKNATDQEEIEILNNRISFFSKPCYAGKTSFFMDHIGNLYRCASSRKKYGNFFSGKYCFDEFPKPCPFTKCVCPYEGMNLTVDKKASAISIANEMVMEYATKLIRAPFVFVKKRLPGFMKSVS